MEANSKGGQGSRRAVEPGSDDDDEILERTFKTLQAWISSTEFPTYLFKLSFKLSTVLGFDICTSLPINKCFSSYHQGLSSSAAG